MRGTTLGRHRRQYRGRVVAILASAAGAALGAGAGHDRSADATVYTYAGPFTGTGYFSNTSSWVGGMTPVSSPSTQLVFNDFGTNSYTATSNVSNPFVLNSLTVNNFGTGSVTVNSPTGQALEFNGSGAAITIAGPGNVALDNNGTGGAVTTILDTTVTVGGVGNGTLTIESGGSAIAGTGGLAVNLTGLGILSLQGSANSFTGGLTLNAGSLNLSGGPGTGTLVINGGNLRTTTTVANSVTANADLFQTTGIGTFSGVISGSAGVRLANVVNPTFTNDKNTVYAALTLSNANTFAGPVTIDSSPLQPSGSSPFFFSSLLVPSTGTLGNTSAITVGENGTLEFTGSTANSRLGNTSAPVTLNGGRLTAQTLTAGTAFTQTFGTVNASGSDTITVQTQTSGTVVTDALTFGNLTQTDNGTLFFRGGFIGSGATIGVATATFGTAGLANVADPAAPNAGTGQAIGVVPFASAVNGISITTTTPGAFVTYNASAASIQVIPVNNTAFVNTSSGTLSSATAHLNVYLNGATTLSGTNPVNALAIASGQTVSGTGAVSVYSGAVVTTGAVTLDGPTLAFNTNTGYIHLGGTLSVVNSATITGSSGVVIAAPQQGTLSTLVQNGSLLSVAFTNAAAGNPFTGGLTLNDVNAQFNNDNELGAAGGAITLGGGYLTYTNASTGLTLNRPVRLGAAGGGANSATTGQVLTLAGVISGPGSFTVNPGSGTGDITALTAANTYAGSTYVYYSTLNVASDANLGAGPVVLGTNSTFQVSSPATLTHPINLEGSSSVPATTATLDTESNNVTLAGVISGTPALTKTGTGTLTLTGNDAALSSPLTISAGGLTLAGNGAIPQVPTITLNSAVPEFRIDDSGTNLPDRVGDFATIVLPSTTNLHLIGNASAAASETIGLISLAAGSVGATSGSSIVTVDGATAGLTVSTAVFNASGFTGGLTKAGTGTLYLAGNASNYSGGTAISAGAVRVNNTAGSGTGSGPVAIATGATLGGSGTIAGTVLVNGTITAGATATATGTLRTGGQSWEFGGGLLTKVSADATASDLLVMSALTIDASNGSFAISVTSTGTPTLPAGGYLVLAVDTESSAFNPFNGSSPSFDLSGLGTPNVTGLQSATGIFQLQTQADSTGNGGFDLILVAAPEPTGLALVALSVAPLALARRRHRRGPDAVTDGRAGR